MGLKVTLIGKNSVGRRTPTELADMRVQISCPAWNLNAVSNGAYIKYSELK